jgi:hypothetical protein
LTEITQKYRFFCVSSYGQNDATPLKQKKMHSADISRPLCGYVSDRAVGQIKLVSSVLECNSIQFRAPVSLSHTLVAVI